jgi:exonuclease III
MALGRSRIFLELVKDFRVDIVCLQETIKREFSDAELRRISGGCDFKWHMVPVRGHSRGLLVGVRMDSFDIVEVDKGIYFCSSVVVQKSTGHCFEIINVYGPTQHEFSEEFIGELTVKLMSCPYPVVLGGDFNLIREVCEKSNEIYSQRLMDLFNRFISDMDSRELPRSGPKFTWTNNRSIPSKLSLTEFWSLPSGLFCILWVGFRR